MVVSASRTTHKAGLASGSGAAGGATGAGVAGALCGAAAGPAWKASAGAQAKARAATASSLFIREFSLSRRYLAESVEEGSKHGRDQHDHEHGDMLRLGKEAALPEQEPDRIADQEQHRAG